MSCKTCKGSGFETCPRCSGSGVDETAAFWRNGAKPAKCHRCGGTGKIKCRVCEGQGSVYQRAPRRAYRIEAAIESLVKGIRDRPHNGDLRAGVRSPPSTSAPAASRDPAPTIRAEDLPGQPEPRYFGYSTGEIVIVLVTLLAIVLIFGFGLERALVACEAFIVFGLWSGLRAFRMFRVDAVGPMGRWVEGAAIGFGILCGIMAFALILDTEAGNRLTNWVTSSALTIAASLLGSVFAFGLLELAGQKVLPGIPDLLKRLLGRQP